MRSKVMTIGSFAAISILAGWILAAKNASLRPPSAARARDRQQLATAYGRLPLFFEANRGQADPRAKFLARGNGSTLLLTTQGAVLAVPESRIPNPESRSNAFTSSGAILRMKLAGANSAPEIAGLDELPGVSNYFIGNDPQRWRTNIPQYAKVRYQEVYPGVDLVFYGSDGQLEYDFVVAPGADPGVIQMEFSGADRMALDPGGNLVLDAGGGQIVQRVPAIYQERGGIRKAIRGGYELSNGRRVGFQVAAYDRARPLILDPVLEYSRFFGGSREDEIISIVVDSAGNAYLTGETSSPDLPTTRGALAHPNAVFESTAEGATLAFVAKLNAAGTALVYCTYLGGSKPAVGHDIAVDSAGNAYITGRTEASDFPTQKPLQATFGGGSDDAFITKLNPQGTALVYSTYLGGTVYDQGRSLAVDGAGNVYLTGITESENFPTRNPIQAKLGGKQDTFAAKLNAAGSALIYSTYIGGSENEVGHAIAVDASGNAYITGLSNSPNFPTVKPLQAAHRGEGNDTIVVKVNAAGSALVYSTYLGGSKNDESRGIVVDSAGNAYIAGYTQSSDFPTAKPFQAKFAGGKNDAFLTKLSPDGSTLVFSTFFGGSGNDFGRGLALDKSGNVYVTGYTDSKDFPMKNPLQAGYAGGAADVFVAKFSAAGSTLLYSSYLGGGAYERGRGIDVDASGNAYISGRTESKDFPTTKSPQTHFAGGPNDAFVLKIADR